MNDVIYPHLMHSDVAHVAVDDLIGVADVTISADTTHVVHVHARHCRAAFHLKL